jgi:hypothetical protein
MSIIHPLVVFRAGDNWEFTGPINDVNGNPLPLTGAAMTWKLDSLDLTKNYITQILSSGNIINLALAIVLYGANASQTLGIVPGTYYDTLRVILADGITTFTVVEGLINVAPTPQ